MPEDLFPQLDPLLESPDPAAGLDFLIARYLTAKEYGLLFEARLMKKRHELGLPLIQTDALTREDYQESVIAAAREAGELFLADGKIERAWPYFRAVSEPGPIFEAINRITPGENLEGVISIAFQEGVHPLKGLELILAQHGMCRAITAFGMTAVQKDREKCIVLLAQAIHEEIVRRMGSAIEAREGVVPASRSLPELMQGRDWLFGEWDYYVDTSHLLSVVPYGVEVTDKAALTLFAELCDYGQHLAAQFQSAGVPPFEDQFGAYGHYIQALLGNDVEAHLDYFRRQITESDPEVVGDAPGRHLARLLISLNRPADALNVVIDHVFEDAPYGAPVPSALQLCYQAKDFSRLREIARERGDLLSYAAGSILAR
ncbi:MAG: hypothetical protein ABUS49_01425 [Acidobacteriota bacterium]